MPKERSYSLDNIVHSGEWSYNTGFALYMPTIIQALLSSNGEKKLQHLSVSGMLMKSMDELLVFFQGHGGRCIIHKHDAYSYIWDDSFIDIEFNKKTNTISIGGYVLDQKIMDLVPELEKDFVSKVKKNLVFTIVKQGESLVIKNMGDGSSPLIDDNYLPEVLEDVEYVIKSFQKSPPGGRICILNGEPGTGKTHLIRSILMQLDCVFLIVPSNMIDSLDKPDFLPLLMNIKSEHEKSIIMIIEDGDTCLVPRKNDNISTIASLLNLSDGILGSIIDIKMIISTNANIEEMDQAILRPGRLCKNIHVGALPYEQANRVYHRLMKDDTIHLHEKRYYTIAEIYDKFNNVDLIQDSGAHTHTKKVIGFATPLQESPNRTLNKAKKIGFE